MNSLPAARPRQSAGPAPLRRPGSVRRTSSIDVSWPDGRAGAMRMDGRAHDIVTPSTGGAPVVRAEDSFVAWLKLDRTITAIEATPSRPALARLVGARGGGGLRQALEEAAPDERRNATPLYLILDDISGTSLVSGWAWSGWNPSWRTDARAMFTDEQLKKAYKDRENVCIGFTPGSSAFDEHKDDSATAVPDLRNPDDPDGWHVFTEQKSVGMRRARRIDVWRDDNVIVVDAAFQDSASTPAGGRTAVHEYSLNVTADPITLQLLSIEATPRVLPHVECVLAPLNLSRLRGTSILELRKTVPTELRGPAGCTHLNDAMRALAEVPALVKYLDG
jgi:Protein of unknown function (DUF2889)